LKKTLLIILTRFGSLINWKWLTLWAGALLLCFMQSCKTKVQENSSNINQNDTTDAEKTMCYDPAFLPEPFLEVPDSNVIEQK